MNNIIIEVQYWKSSLGGGFEKSINRLFFTWQRTYNALYSQQFRRLDDFTFEKGILRATISERTIEE
jgi:hypothetical protein